jgi:hypothetical protein
VYMYIQQHTPNKKMSGKTTNFYLTAPTYTRIVQLQNDIDMNLLYSNTQIIYAHLAKQRKNNDNHNRIDPKK